VKWLVVFALVGCDKVFLDGAKPDAPPPSDVVNPIDVSNLAFGTPMPIDGVNTSNEEDRPTLTDDMLELYFHRTVSMQTSMYVAKRDTRESPFNAPEPVDLMMPGNNLRGCISGDGLRLYFSYYVSVADQADIYLATRPDRTSPWETPVRIEEVSTVMADYCGWERADHLVMFGSRDEGALRRFEIWTTARETATQPYNPPMLIPQFNTMAGAEGAPWADADANIVVFDRRNPSGVGIHQATRQGTQYAVRALAELDQGAGTGSPWLSSDGRTIVYVKDVNGGDIYMATR
jgi:hypothetical protein